MRRSKKPTCFGWAPTLSSARSLVGSMGHIVSLSFLMQIPETLADVFFKSVNPINKIESENALVCCNGQEVQIAQVLESDCGIYDVRVDGEYGDRVADYRYIEDIGTTRSGAPACNLFYLTNVRENPCFEGVFKRNVTNGLPDQCEPVAEFMKIITGVALGGGAVLISGFLIFYLIKKRLRRGVIDEATPLNDSEQTADRQFKPA